MENCKLKMFQLFLVGLLVCLILMLNNIAGLGHSLNKFKKTGLARKLSGSVASASENCSLNVAVLRNQKLGLTWGQGRQFVSVLKSVCFTQLGNHLSAYATLLYFKRKFGFNAMITPYQAFSIGQVMKVDQMEIKPLHFALPSCDSSKCLGECQAPSWQSVNRHHKGQDFTDIMKNPAKYMYNKLLDLGNHTVPIYLYKEILSELREEFTFQDQFIRKSTNFLNTLREKDKSMIYVGVHARRGDHLESWRRKFPDSEVGSFEGTYFNYAMDMFRNKYNKNNTKVVFIATSDDFAWIKQNFVNPGDIYFTKELAKVSACQSIGVDLATLSLCDHSIIDYGTFGVWGALLCGGKIVVPGGYSDRRTPDMRWWMFSGMEDTVEVVDIRKMTSL